MVNWLNSLLPHMPPVFPFKQGNLISVYLHVHEEVYSVRTGVLCFSVLSYGHPGSDRESEQRIEHPLRNYPRICPRVSVIHPHRSYSTFVHPKIKCLPLCMYLEQRNIFMNLFKNVSLKHYC